VLINPESLSEQNVKETHGDLMRGHESTYNTKEKVMASYWLPGTDSKIDQHIQTFDKCQKTRRDYHETTTFL
jgi:hypothetical protein